jgi:hypothetical protein
VQERCQSRSGSVPRPSRTHPNIGSVAQLLNFVIVLRLRIGPRHLFDVVGVDPVSAEPPIVARGCAVLPGTTAASQACWISGARFVPLEVEKSHALDRFTTAIVIGSPRDPRPRTARWASLTLDSPRGPVPMRIRVIIDGSYEGRP